MQTYLVYTVFFMVLGQYCSSTEVEARNEEEAAAKVEGIRAGGRAKVTAVFEGRA